MRVFAFILLFALSSMWPLDAVASDWSNPPLYVVSEKVELIVGPEFTVVSGRYRFEYVAQDDTQQLPRIGVHYPLYLRGTLSDWQEIPGVMNFTFQIAGQVIAPSAGRIVPAESLSDYPVPEDGAAAFLTFEIPRELAVKGFDVTIKYTQPNFNYRGGRMAIYTPWLPKLMQHHPYLALADNVFELSMAAANGVVLQRIPTELQVRRESITEIVISPEHRKTIAVEIQSASGGSKK